MILMAMGDDDGFQPGAVFHQPGHVGHDKINAGRGVHVGECHPQIDQQQPFAALGPIAIDIGVHPDLTRATQRQIDQPVLAHSVSSSLL